MSVSYTFVTQGDQKFVSYTVFDEREQKYFQRYDASIPFELMPEYSKEEKAQRNKENNCVIDEMIDVSWKAEQDRQKAIKLAYKKLPKKKRLETEKPTFPITTKEAWRKKHGEATRLLVETKNPPISISERKCPSENVVFATVIVAAYEAGVPEETLNTFVERIRTMGKSSIEAAQAVFEHFAKDPERLSRFCWFVPPKKCEIIEGSIKIPEELIELFHQKLYFPRNTGKGELGVMALFAGNLELVSFDKKGDFIWNKGTPDEESPEVKSIENRHKSIRFGTTGSWIGTEIQKRVLAIPELKAMSVSLGQKVVQKHAPLIKKHLNMTLTEFYETVSKELRAVIRSFDRMLVFIEDENVLEEIDANKVYLYGTDGSGRFQFTLSPNNFTKLV